MIIAHYSESSADQAALAVFTEGILGEPPEPAGIDLEGRGVKDVLGRLDGVFRGVYYRSDAVGLVVVVDCDDQEMHMPDHDPATAARDGCRFCQIHNTIENARKKLSPRPNRPPLRVAIGLAVPAIEAWYLAGKNHQVGEAAWIAGLAAGQLPFTRPKLKELVYGTSRPSLEYQTARAVKEARRIIQDIKAIEVAFPVGFGLMAKEIRSWAAPQLPELPDTDPFWQRMKTIWAGQKARGHVPRSVEEIEAERRAFRDEWEERAEEIERLQRESEEARRRASPSPEQPG